jgi:hypothetical protein
MQIAMLPQMVALLMLTLWGLTVLQGVLGKRQVAAWLGMATAVLAVLPFAPRVMHYLFDSEGFVTRYGGAVLALALAALLATPFVASRAWGWLLPALASLPPVAFYVWLVFFFRIIF